MIQMLTHRKLRLVLSILAIMALIACDLAQEPKPPTWSNTIEFPIIKETVSLDDLKNEDNISEQLYLDGSDQKTIFAYSDTSVMDSQAVGEQLAFNDINQAFDQSVEDVSVTGSSINQTSAFDPVGVDPIEEIIPSEMGPIELDNIDPTSPDPFQLDEIVPDVASIPNGTTTTIDAGELEPITKPFTFDAFSSADFTDGDLTITINNNMVIALGSPINIQLQDSDGNDIDGGLVTWNTIIPTNGSESRILDLSGMTLPGSILVEVTGSTVGSQGSDILIDAEAKASSFNILISGAGLVVSSATAKVPSQTIAESGAMTMTDSENKIEEAQIKSGSLKIEIENDMEVASDLQITITSLEDTDGTAFTTTIPILENETALDVTNIAGYSLVMDVQQQEVQYNYNIVTRSTGDDLVTLAETDEVTVTIALYGVAEGEQLFFNGITGIIEPQTIDEAGEIAISSDSKLLVADISSGSISIDIDNQINKPDFQGLPTIVLTIPELVDASSAALTGSLTLQPSPAENLLTFDLSNYDLVFPDTATQVLTYTTQVTTNAGELGKFGLEDSIFVDIEVSDMEFASVNGYFTQDAIVTVDEILLEEETKLVEAIFETGNLALSMTNGIGVIANVDFKIDEFINIHNGDTLQLALTLEEITTPQVTNIDLSNYKLAFHPDSVAPGVDQAIHYKSTVSLPPDELMTLTFGNSIAIDVDITDLAMESITGIIEADTMVIEESEQSIDMPDMVADLMFEQVNIDIDFNSTFEVPIELTLNLSGTNEDGESESISITQNITPEDDLVRINAADLLNIHPEAIVSSGQAIVGGGTEASTIAKGQGMNPVMYINVPLSLIIEDPPFLDMDVTSMDTIIPEDGSWDLDEVVLFAEAINMFEFGATVVVLASPDSMKLDSLYLATPGAVPPDTLLTMELMPRENADLTIPAEPIEIVLSEDKISLLEEELFLKPQVQLLGRLDNSGNSVPSRFFTTDSLTLRTWGSISYTIHGEEF